MRRTARPATISDLMILVAAIAAGLGLGEFWRVELSAQLPEFTAIPPRTHLRTLVAGRIASLLIPATLAVLILRLRRPWPRFGLLFRQPGSVACVASAAALLVQAVNLRLDLRTMGGYTSPLLVAAWYWPVAVCSAVLAAWLSLLGGRGWHPGDWVDRLGVLVGAGWTILPPLLWVVEFG